MTDKEIVDAYEKILMDFYLKKSKEEMNTESDIPEQLLEDKNMKYRGMVLHYFRRREDGVTFSHIEGVYYADEKDKHKRAKKELGYTLIYRGEII